jgi:alpha-1,2-mannosyltransferase
MKQKRHWHYTVLSVTIGLSYAILYYLVIKQQFRLDFTSFYASIEALKQGVNPYQVLPTAYLDTVILSPANLNPPTLLMLFTPLTWLDYSVAQRFMIISSSLLGLLSALMVFKLSLPSDIFQKNAIKMLLMYLMLFSTLVNAAIMQLGSLMAFVIYTGYIAYLKRHDFIAGFLWGTIISIKIFPGLLLIYAIRQQRIKLCIFAILTTIFLWTLPWVLYGYKVYEQYYHLINDVIWYGNSWNGSLNGFLFRAVIDTNDLTQSLLGIRLTYLFLFCIILACFVKKLWSMDSSDDKHRQFALTLIMMLMLSPFSYVYYFSILLLPMAISWRYLYIKRLTIKPMMLWLICFFLLNFPLDYVSVKNMIGIGAKLTLYSSYFYGLLLIFILIANDKYYSKTIQNKAYFSLAPVVTIILFGFCVILMSMMMRLYLLNFPI